MDTSGFFHLLFDGKPATARIVLWTWPNKRSRCFTDPEDAARWCGHLEGYDIYVHVALAAHDILPTNRIRAADAAGIVGLWADIDIAGPAHTEKKVYPPDMASARGLVMAMPRPPTLLVDSGHGLHAWWLFERPWMFADDAERRQAAAMAKGWIAELQTRAARMGWDIDATHDLARVLRVPGTVNSKQKDAPVRVRVLDG
jgi:hypothetical protein